VQTTFIPRPSHFPVEYGILLLPDGVTTLSTCIIVAFILLTIYEKNSTTKKGMTVRIKIREKR
jgi:hypothetical protein